MNMALTNLAKKYALAFLNCYQSKLSLEDSHNFAIAAQELKKNTNFIILLSIPYISDAIKIKALEKIKERYKLPSLIDHLLNLLIKNHHGDLLALVLNAINQIYNSRHKILSVTIKSSRALDDKQLVCIRKFLSEKTGCEIITTTSIDPQLIAGIRIEATTYIWEHSVAQHLRQARQLVTS